MFRLCPPGYFEFLALLKNAVLIIARIVGLNPKVVLAELERIISSQPELSIESPFGDGKASERIVGVLEKELLL